MKTRYLEATAVLDPTETFRYLLTRRWAVKGGTVLFVMLNPSTADGRQDDPTIRRCVAFARGWSEAPGGPFAALEVANLYGFRATDPAQLLGAPDPIGPWNDKTMLERAVAADLVVAAWGANKEPIPGHRERVLYSLRVNAKRDVHCLTTTKDGHPGHPLYQPKDTVPVVFAPKLHAGQENAARWGEGA